jgi:hypothetical protein
VARLNTDGSVDAAFDPDVFGNVKSMEARANGEIFLAGNFATVFGQSHSGLALLLNDPATQSISLPDLTQILWMRGGSLPEVSGVTFELSIDDGANWSLLGAGTRIAGGWQITGLNLPASAVVRARGHTTNGQNNGNSSLVEMKWIYPPAPRIAVKLANGTQLTDGASSVDFGKILAGTSVSQTFTILNTGNAGLAGLSVGIDGDAGGNFLLTTPPPATLDAGGQATFTVQFTAGALGVNNAALHLASNVPGSANPFDILLTGTGLTRLENWRQTWFQISDNIGNAADTADPDGDGLTNLMEFALNTNPTRSGVSTNTVLRNGDNLEFTYQRSDAAVAEGVQFSVEWTDDLGSPTWGNAGVNETVLSDDGTVQQVKATIPAGPGLQRFVRLKVAH